MQEAKVLKDKVKDIRMTQIMKKDPSNSLSSFDTLSEDKKNRSDTNYNSHDKRTGNYSKVTRGFRSYPRTTCGEINNLVFMTNPSDDRRLRPKYIH